MKSQILLACLLVATFTQPIGTSMQGFVIQHTVAWCEGFQLPIRIESQVFQGEGGPPAGSTRTDYYPVPKPQEETPTIPSQGANPSMWSPP